MESALSEEEFHRLQLQLIELRTENYQISDKCKKQEGELTNLNQRLTSLDKEFQRATKAINKSKKAKEVELLIQENDSLQRKLHSQEEEFRLQNSTLMQELSLLISKNEELETTLSSQDGHATDDVIDAPCTDNSSELTEEIMRLTAENTALQTNVGDIKLKFDNELKLLRSAVEGVDITESDSSQGANADVSLSNLIQESELLSQYNDVKLSLDTEKAENKLLHERLTELKKTSSAEAADQLREKLKKKQESYVTLQNEKESLYAESNQKIVSLEEARQRDIKNFHNQIDKLNEELKVSKEETAKTQEKCEQRVRDFEITIATLKSKVDEKSAKNLELAQREVERLQGELDALTQRFSDEQVQGSETRDKLQTQDRLVSSLQHQLTELQNSLSSTQAKLAEKSQAAEKRKKLLDELAIKSQEDSDLYKSKLLQLELSRKQEVEALTSTHEAGIRELTHLLDVEKVKALQSAKFQSDLESLNEEYRSLEQTKSWLQRSLHESEEKLKETEIRNEDEQAQLQASQDQLMSDVTSQHEASVRAFEEQLLEKSGELKRVSGERDSFQQKVADNIQDMKLHEKKGAGLMKDLKRQLAQERKRADRLDLRVQELSSSETKRMPSAEPFFLPMESERLSVRADDASSVSSWSGANYSNLGNSSVARDISIASNRESSPHSSPAQNSEHDVASLLVVTESLQKEKTSLSERVSILEQSNSAMAEDLLKKQSIIEYYTMEGKEHVNSTPKRAEKMTLKRVMDFVKDKGDEGLNEKYRQCQRILEETLTKNMYLQNDLEELSKQLAKARLGSNQS